MCEATFTLNYTCFAQKLVTLIFVECFQSFGCDDRSSFDCVGYVGCIGVWIVCVVLPCFETILSTTSCLDMIVVLFVYAWSFQ